MLAELHRLLDHLRWADRAAADSLASAGTPEEAVELYAHVLGAEHVWLARLEGRAAAHPVWPALNLAECARLADATHAALQDFVDRLTPEALDAEVAYRNSAGQAFRTRVGDILLHVCLHGAYHRGQIATLLRRAGSAPASTDYIAFVRGAPAATRRPAAAPDGSSR